ncbi:MAG TPA: diaminopimelate dehydrogenase, partial [Clostridia bacterium]|nr:diaminopimelate dehydrogenase [Clostridia bacterium]
MEKIKIGIVGYGNIGKAVEIIVNRNEDMELVGVFTRRDPNKVSAKTPGVKVYGIDEAERFKND